MVSRSLFVVSTGLTILEIIVIILLFEDFLNLFSNNNNTVINVMYFISMLIYGLCFGINQFIIGALSIQLYPSNISGLLQGFRVVSTYFFGAIVVLIVGILMDGYSIEWFWDVQLVAFAFMVTIVSLVLPLLRKILIDIVDVNVPLR